MLLDKYKRNYTLKSNDPKQKRAIRIAIIISVIIFAIFVYWKYKMG